MNTFDYLAAVKAKLGISSDYALAKALGVSKTAIRNWNLGHCGFNDETARRVAEILGKHPGIVMLDMHRERAQTPETKELWDEISEKFSVGFEYLISRSTPRRYLLAA